MYSFNEEEYYPNDITTHKLSQIIRTSDDEILHQHGLYPRKYVNLEHYFYVDSRNRQSSENPLKFKIMFSSNPGEGIIYNIDFDHFTFLQLKEIHVPLKFLSQNEINARVAIMRIKELCQNNIHYSNSKYNENTDIMLFKIGNNKTHNIYETKTIIDLKNNYQKNNCLHFELLNENAEPIKIISDKNLNEHPLHWEIVYNQEKIDDISLLKQVIERFKQHTTTYDAILTEATQYNMNIEQYINKLDSTADAVIFMTDEQVINDIVYVKKRLYEFNTQNMHNNMIIEMRLGVVGKQPLGGLQ